MGYYGYSSKTLYRDDGYLRDRKNKSKKPVVMIMTDKQLYFNSIKGCALYLGLTTGMINKYKNNNLTTQQGYMFRDGTLEEKEDFEWSSMLGCLVRWENSNRNYDYKEVRG